MTTATIGLLYGAATLLAMFAGMPIAFALGRGRDRIHDRVHAGGLGRYHHAERL